MSYRDNRRDTNRRDTNRRNDNRRDDNRRGYRGYTDDRRGHRDDRRDSRKYYTKINHKKIPRTYSRNVFYFLI